MHQTAEQATAEACARAIRGAFNAYNTDFSSITQRARRRFETRDWHGARKDAVERIELYNHSVTQIAHALAARLGDAIGSRELWVAIKQSYEALLAQQIDLELYKTYYNTLTRRFFKTRGVDAEIEFVAYDIEPTDAITHPVERRAYWRRDHLERLYARALNDCEFSVPFADLHHDAALLAERVASELARAWGDDPARGLELLTTVFYRERRAYLVGRIFGERNFGPIVIALKHAERGIQVDAVIVDRDEAAALFGFTRSYFFADLPTVGDAVVMLRGIMPTRQTSELYTILGRAKQGKTERYRDFFRHLNARPDEQFVHADGERGLVMLVFTLPSYPLVFKLIRDRFGPPKNMVRAEVESKYLMVFKHDRGGRLIDAQEFRHLRLPRRQFAPELLAELKSSTASLLIEDGDDLVITHCYVERRLRPLNLYLREASSEAAEFAALDYGQAIKDLAMSNLFPGDLLFKNFGVTRSGRCIFYDYDEICTVTECRFRALPEPSDEAEESSREAFFYVAENDVFPEQFREFLHLPESLRERFMAVHGEIFDPGWWRRLKLRLEQGELPELLPYADAARLSFEVKQ